MVEIFTEYETFINFLAWFLILGGVLAHEYFVQKIQVLIEIITTVAFFVALLNVLINISVKGF